MLVQVRREGIERDVVDIQDYAWTLLGKPLDDRRKGSGRNRLVAADPHFTGARVGEEVDVPDSLFKLMESRKTSLEKGAAVDRRLDTQRPPIQQPYAKPVLEIGND